MDLNLKKYNNLYFIFFIKNKIIFSQTPSITSPTKSILTQQSNSPAPPTRHNGVSSTSHNVSISPKVTSPVYANTNNQQQQLSPQPPPVPAKPKYRPLNAKFAPINGNNHTQNKKQPQNGFENEDVRKLYFFDIFQLIFVQSDLSIVDSERSFKDKKKFFESGFKDPGPKPKRKLNKKI